MSETIMLDEVGPDTGRFADPAYVGVRIMDVKIVNEWCKRRGSGEDVMTCLRGDFVEHIDEVMEKDNTGRVTRIG